MVEACTKLEQPEIVFSALDRTKLLQQSAPLLLVLEALVESGWASKDTRSGTHHPGDERTFTFVDYRSRKHYYQCLLCVETCFAEGLESLPTRAPQSFFKFMLAAPNAEARTTWIFHCCGGCFQLSGIRSVAYFGRGDFLI
jgi:hypothetical protein